MMHSSNGCAPLFFYYVLKRTSLHTLFSYFFLRASLTQRGQNKGKRDLFLSLFLILTYIRNKSHLEFFFLSRAISLTASLRQATHGVRKQEKKGIDFTYDLINVAKIPMWMKKNNSVIKRKLCKDKRDDDEFMKCTMYWICERNNRHKECIHIF
jgi:hypothetical protein